MNKRKFLSLRGVTLMGLGLLVVGLAALLVLGPDFALAEKGGKGGRSGTISAWAIVSDDYPNMVRSDGLGVPTSNRYADGEQCVEAFITKSGLFFFRTVEYATDCLLEPERFLTLEFSYGSWDLEQLEGTTDLDGDGNIEEIEGPPARFHAEKAFAKNRVTTPVRIIIDKLPTTGEVWGELRYQNEAHILVNPDGSRDIYLLNGEATADVVQNQQVINKRGKVSTKLVKVGTFSMPFSVTAGKK